MSRFLMLCIQYCVFCCCTNNVLLLIYYFTFLETLLLKQFFLQNKADILKFPKIGTNLPKFASKDSENVRQQEIKSLKEPQKNSG